MVQIKNCSNMKDIAIYGAGGFGREVACLINKINEKNIIWNLIGFFDDGLALGTQNEYGIILGGIKELNSFSKEISIVIGIGNPVLVKKISTLITNQKIDFPNIVAPNSMFIDPKNIEIGIGNIISFGCTISCNVKIGNFNIFNWNNTIGHDVTIGSYNSFMPSVSISGEVSIIELNFFGVSSTVLQRLKIGKNTIVGANSLITRSTKDNETYVGSPATILRY